MTALRSSSPTGFVRPTSNESGGTDRKAVRRRALPNPAVGRNPGAGTNLLAEASLAVGTNVPAEPNLGPDSHRSIRPTRDDANRHATSRHAIRRGSGSSTRTPDRQTPRQPRLRPPSDPCPMQLPPPRPSVLRPCTRSSQRPGPMRTLTAEPETSLENRLGRTLLQAIFSPVPEATLNRRGAGQLLDHDRPARRFGPSSRCCRSTPWTCPRRSMGWPNSSICANIATILMRWPRSQLHARDGKAG